MTPLKICLPFILTTGAVLGLCSCATIENTYSSDLATNAATFQKNIATLLVPVIRINDPKQTPYSGHVQTYDTLNVLIQQMELDARVVQDSTNQSNLIDLQTKLDELMAMDRAGNLSGTYATEKLKRINFTLSLILLSENSAKAVQDAQGAAPATPTKSTPSN